VPTDMVPGSDSNHVYVADEPGGISGSSAGGIWEVNLSTGAQTEPVLGGSYFAHPTVMRKDASNYLIVGAAVSLTNSAGTFVQIRPSDSYSQHVIYDGTGKNPDYTQGGNGLAVDSANLYLAEIPAAYHPNDSRVNIFPNSLNLQNSQVTSGLSVEGYLATVQGAIIYSSGGGAELPVRHSIAALLVLNDQATRVDFPPGETFHQYAESSGVPKEPMEIIANQTGPILSDAIAASSMVDESAAVTTALDSFFARLDVSRTPDALAGEIATPQMSEPQRTL
jgi:hypothetical protein